MARLTPRAVQPPAATSSPDGQASAVALEPPAVGAPVKAPVTRIESSRHPLSLGLREVWHYHELLYFLIWRDIKVRYKQTVVGALWVIVQPVMTMLIFNFVFGRLAGLPSNGIPYPLFVFSGLLPWQLFVAGLMGAGTGVVGSAGLITKVYFPRLIIPIGSVVSGLVDFAIAFFVLVGLMVYYGVTPGVSVLAVPAFVLLAMVTALAVGLWLSMLNVRYRDIQYTIPFLTQIWLFLTPIAYASGLIPARYRGVIALNPMTSVVEGFRWSLLGGPAPFGPTFFVSIAVVAALLVGGLFFFKWMERTFADVI